MKSMKLVLLALALSVVEGGCADDRIHLTIFHTNDIHGWIMARDGGRMSKDPKRQLGGFAALTARVRSHNGPKMLLDGGDWFQGTPEGGMTEGRAPVELFGAAGYDAAVIGNHDFDNGEAALRKLLKTAKTPILAANIYDEKTGKRVPWVKDHMIKEVAGVKVGLFGLLTTNMRSLTFEKNYKGLTFRREADEAREQVAALKAEGAELIIALTHVGIEKAGMGHFHDDQEIAREAPGIDVIVGGHTHTPLYKPVREPKSGTWIVQAGHYLQHVGVLNLALDRDTHKIEHAYGHLEPLWLDQTGEAEDVKAVVKKFQDEVGKELDVAIGDASGPLLRSQTEESQMGDWMTDCLRDHDHVDAAFQNAGGIRSELDAGPVTLREIYQIMPFDNRIVLLKMKGAPLREILENGVAGTHGLLQLSGVHVVFDPKRETGKKILEATVGGKPLDDKKTYSVAATDFMTTGGDGYTAFKKADKTDNKETLMRDVLTWCVRRSRTVAPPKIGRIDKR